MKPIFLSAATGAMLLFGLTGPASASLIISASVGGAATGTTLDNLDAATDPNLSLVGIAELVTGSLSGQYAAPYFSGGEAAQFGEICPPAGAPDCSQYVSVFGGADDAKYTFPTNERYLGLLWGSVDTYNSLCFYNSSSVGVGCITGSDVTASANGDQGVNGTFYVNINSSDPFAYAEFTSQQNSFEFDDIAYSPNEQIPEPLTLSLFGAGLVGAVTLRLRRKKVA
jgi:hypothetical protein